jgi:hypothetical protein
MQLHFLLPFFQWCDKTMLGQFVRGGRWEFPLIETLHILALTMLYGCVVILSLRLMGVLMSGWSVAHLAEEVSPWLHTSLTIILVTGVLLYLSEAVKAFGNDAFWLKVYLLTAALIFHFTIFRKVTKSPAVSPGIGKLVGALSIFLWLGIGCAGRAIGFV